MTKLRKNKAQESLGKHNRFTLDFPRRKEAGQGGQADMFFLDFFQKSRYFFKNFATI